MKIKNHTISITPDELETLGLAMEMYLEHEMKIAPKHFDEFYKDEIELLRSLTWCGYSMWLNPMGKVLNGKSTTDVEEWIRHQKKLLKKQPGDKLNLP